ncbi:MAG: putative holin [Gammaproteobacteria bacterium]
MQRNVTRLLPWLVVSIILALAALFAQSQAPGNIIAVSLYKAHLLSLGGWIGYWLDRGLFPYDRPHEYLLPEAEELDTIPPDAEVLEGVGELVDGRNYGSAMIRRAIIVAAALICVGLGA